MRQPQSLARPRPKMIVTYAVTLPEITAGCARPRGPHVALGLCRTVGPYEPAVPRLRARLGEVDRLERGRACMRCCLRRLARLQPPLARRLPHRSAGVAAALDHGVAVAWPSSRTRGCSRTRASPRRKGLGSATPWRADARVR